MTVLRMVIFLSVTAFFYSGCGPHHLADDSKGKQQKAIVNPPSPDNRFNAPLNVSDLVERGPQALPEIRDSLPRVDEISGPVLLGLVALWQDRQSIPAILPLTSSSSEKLRNSAIECLGRLGAVNELSAILSDKTYPHEVRAHAARSLALFKKLKIKHHVYMEMYSNVEQILIGLLSDNSSLVVGEAIGSLRYLESENALPYLEQLINHPDKRIAAQTQKAVIEIARSGGSAIGAATSQKTNVLVETVHTLPYHALSEAKTFNYPAYGSFPWAEIIEFWNADIQALKSAAKQFDIELSGLVLPGRSLQVPDPFRLDFVNSLLQNPLDSIPKVVPVVEHIRRKNGNNSLPSISTAFTEAAIFLTYADSHKQCLANAGEEIRPTLSNAVLMELHNQKQLPNSKYIRKLSDMEQALPPSLSRALGGLYSEISQLHNAWDQRLQILSDKDRDRLYTLALSLYKPEISLKREEHTWIASQVAGLKSNSLLAAEKRFIIEVERAMHVIGNFSGWNPPKELVLPCFLETPLGTVCLYGPGNDTIRRGGCLVIDFGGKDRIRCPAGAIHEKSVHVSLYLDIAGNDQYFHDIGPAFGAGILGTGVLVDMQGNDTYTSGHISQGTGVIGTGIQVDLGGNDYYSARSMSQGSAGYGVGILIDGSGDDRYESGFISQGFGAPGGTGILWDQAGDDFYRAGGLVKDDLRDPSHYLSMSQGFGMGLRLDMDYPPRFSQSGGVGLLADFEGNDHYIVDVFGQGAAYYFGAGILFDAHGQDTYHGFNYTQGAGMHSAFGTIIDIFGDDRYQSDHHSGGMGLDRSAGILFDIDGNDRHEHQSDCMGSGVKPFGLGIMIDHQGNDEYQCSTGLGNAREPRFWPSQWPTGLFFDRRGRDTFSFNDKGLNGSIRLKGRRGIGVDGE